MIPTHFIKQLHHFFVSCGLLLGLCVAPLCAGQDNVGRASAPPVFLTTSATNYNARDFLRVDGTMDAALQFIPASDPRFLYEGRFDFANAAGPVMAWQAGRIQIDFEGDRLGLRFDRLDGQSFFDVQVDDAVWILALRRGRHQRLAFQRPLTPGRHHLTIFKRSEANAGIVRFKGIELAAGAKAWSPAPVNYPLAMEFFGDSITVGVQRGRGRRPIDQPPHP